MKTSFSDTAERLSAIAGHWFGWSTDQFWRATPKELADIVGASKGSNGDGGLPLTQTQLDKLKDQFPDG